jgi:molybdopterin/thiamine biosynthesis adenylyltransferase
MPEPPTDSFDRDQAFGRTVGWVTKEELSALAEKTVAIAGLGGVGGAHLVTLARLGIGGFRIADPDAFELANMNRQVGAGVSTIGSAKAEVMAARAQDINPELRLHSMSAAIDESNVDDLLDGADLFVDGLDLFAMDARRLVFARCEARSIPAITAGPLGMGAAQMIFVPGGMSFERYFRLEGASTNEQLLRFVVGLAPASLQRFYVADPGALDLAAQCAPSTPMGCALASGMAATAALALLLGRKEGVLAAPWSTQYDAYRQRLKRAYRPWGNGNWLQRFTIAMARRALF